MIRRLSLHARLLLLAALTGVAALLFAAFGIGEVLQGFVLRGVDERLDTQIAILADAVTPQGRLDRAHVVELPPFAARSQGWGWRVQGAAGTWASGADVAAEPVRRGHGHGEDRIRSGRGRTARGLPLYVRRLELATPAGAVEIVAAAPRAIIDRPLREAMGPLLLSLGLLGLGLVVSIWLQLRYGLGPVRALRDAVARVRSGETARLPADQPRELQPLADEVNALIAQNAAGLDHARRHLANLAHGLKTPLATLSLRLARDGAPAETRALVAQLDARIAHHLRRARSAAATTGQRARTEVAEVAADLVDAVGRVHAARALRFDTAVDPSLIAAVDRQDLDELLGNLLDNAACHARSRVRLSARADGLMLDLDVEDDGAGMTEEEAALALRPGARLDESGIGYGLGLNIVQELAELYGGALRLARSESLGGLLARITLPRQT